MDIATSANHFYGHLFWTICAAWWTVLSKFKQFVLTFPLVVQLEVQEPVSSATLNNLDTWKRTLIWEIIFKIDALWWSIELSTSKFHMSISVLYQLLISLTMFKPLTHLNYLWRHLITMNISKVISGWREKINIRQSAI